MKTIKKFKLINSIKLVLIALLLVACSNDDDNTQGTTKTALELDRDALIEIFNANTSNTLPWDITTTDLTSWEGVVTDGVRVTAVNIVDRNLETLPVTAMEQLTALTTFTANNNGFTSIDLSSNINLTKLALYNNYITFIDVSNNVLLEQLLLETNDLTTIDVSALANLIDLKAHSNDLTDANIANGNNTNMWRMNLGDNNDITCIKVDAGVSKGFDGWVKPFFASYNTVCP